MALRVGTTAHQNGGFVYQVQSLRHLVLLKPRRWLLLKPDRMLSTSLLFRLLIVSCTEIQWRDKATGTLVGEAAEFAETFYVMENLNPGTTYEWRVATLNSGFTGWVEFTTVGNRW
jgi:hypothetical protein